jgi:hypothetical protein
LCFDPRLSKAAARYPHERISMIGGRTPDTKAVSNSSTNYRFNVRRCPYLFKQIALLPGTCHYKKYDEMRAVSREGFNFQHDCASLQNKTT